jgi:class 3 adenylate cyclase
VEDRVRFEPRGELTLKGFSAPVPAHRVLGLKEAACAAPTGPALGVAG